MPIIGSIHGVELRVLWLVFFWSPLALLDDERFFIHILAVFLATTVPWQPRWCDCLQWRSKRAKYPHFQLFVFSQTIGTSSPSKYAYGSLQCRNSRSMTHYEIDIHMHHEQEEV